MIKKYQIMAIPLFVCIMKIYIRLFTGKFIVLIMRRIGLYFV